MSYILATGYGRKSLEWADAEMSELSCHAKAAYFLFPDARTVIDIGGQDAKVMRLSNDGMLRNFAMNNKCAAGTGRFLDVMARVMEVKVDDLERLSAQSTQTVNISSTCTVFAESEVISQLANNTNICDIVKGIHRSVAGRVAGLAKGVGIEDAVIMSGGVARNGGVVAALEEELGKKIYVSPLAQYAGALGAALLAYQKYTN
jgi:predicted CoA-substrate-specific enzyme activase